MKQTWKPGDVAQVSSYGNSEVAICYHGGVVDRGTGDGTARWRTGDTELWSSVSSARRLVVIDPEDREQVARLRQIYDDECEWRHGIVFADTAPQRTEAFHAALRSLIATPEPNEPQGLGAVVEDDRGYLWFRMAIENQTWPGEVWQRQHNSVGRWSTWDAITAVKVLSEGVTP